MKTLFFRTLLSSITALLILLGALSAFLYLGFERSLDSWSENKLAEVTEGIETILKDKTAVDQVYFPENISVFIYGTDQRLIFSNRGEGKTRSFAQGGDVNRVYNDETLIGYYHIGNISFQNDYANQQFISSMTSVIWIGAVISVVLALAYALLFSRGLAKPAIAVARGIGAIAAGDLENAIPESGTAEISQIGRAANELRTQLKRERLLRGQWAQDVAHDLRTPISALKAQFEGILDGVLPLDKERIHRNLGEILRVEKLINDLQELMQLETRELQPKLMDVPIGPLVRAAVDVFAFEIQRKEISLEMKVNGESVHADENLLFRAVSNILSNAVRYVPPGGSISVSTQIDSGTLLLKVNNSGEMIPAEELDRVFDRLYRGDHARHTPGSGLGLTITRQIVELHNGTVGIESSESAGTTVTIGFPVFIQSS